MTAIDFLVIGGGIAGASVAAGLSRHGKVVVLEAEDHAGYHSTGRSASMSMEFHADAAVRALVRVSRTFLAAPPTDFAPAGLLRDRGVLFIARRDQHDAAERMASRLFPDAGHVVRGDERLALERLPALRRGYVSTCLWYPDAQEIDVHALLSGYLADCRRHGGEVVTGARVAGLDRTGSAWIVRSERAEFRAAVVVNAAGAWADEVGRMAGAVRLGLVPRRRSACIVPAGNFDVAGWPMVGDVDEAFYFKPEAGDILLSPSEAAAVGPCDPQADDLEIARAVDGLEAATHFKVERKIRRQWAGLRSFVADELPVVGFDPLVPGFFWLAAQGGDGIQTSPALSRLAEASLVGDPTPADLGEAGVSLHTFSPRRLEAA